MSNRCGHVTCLQQCARVPPCLADTGHQQAVGPVCPLRAGRRRFEPLGPHDLGNYPARVRARRRGVWRTKAGARLALRRRLPGSLARAQPGRQRETSRCPPDIPPSRKNPSRQSFSSPVPIGAKVRHWAVLLHRRVSAVWSLPAATSQKVGGSTGLLGLPSLLSCFIERASPF